MRRIFSYFIVISLMLFLFTSPVHAEEVNVDHVAGGIEKIFEKINLFLRFDKTSKTKYLEYLTEKRFGELKYSINKDNNFIEPTSSRFSTYLGLLLNTITDYKISKEKNTVIDIANREVSQLKNLQSKFPHDSGWWLSIQWSVDNLNHVPNKLANL